LSTKEVGLGAAGSHDFFVLELSEKTFDVQRPGHHGEATIGRAGPLFLRPVTIQFDAVAIRVL
jgi:hypothetical protein